MLMLSLSSGTSGKPNVEATTTSMKSSCAVSSSCSRSSSGRRGYQRHMRVRPHAQMCACAHTGTHGQAGARGAPSRCASISSAIFVSSSVSLSGAFFSILSANSDSLSIKSAIVPSRRRSPASGDLCAPACEGAHELAQVSMQKISIFSKLEKATILAGTYLQRVISKNNIYWRCRMEPPDLSTRPVPPAP